MSKVSSGSQKLTSIRSNPSTSSLNIMRNLVVRMISSNNNLIDPGNIMFGPSECGCGPSTNPPRRRPTLSGIGGSIRRKRSIHRRIRPQELMNLLLPHNRRHHLVQCSRFVESDSWILTQLQCRWELCLWDGIKKIWRFRENEEDKEEMHCANHKGLNKCCVLIGKHYKP